MAKIIVFERPEGGVSTMTPIDPEMSIEQIAEKDVPNGIPYLIIDDSELPPDNRDNWKIKGDQVIVDQDALAIIAQKQAQELDVVTSITDKLKTVGFSDDQIAYLKKLVGK